VHHGFWPWLAGRAEQQLVEAPRLPDPAGWGAKQFALMDGWMHGGSSWALALDANHFGTREDGDMEWMDERPLSPASSSNGWMIMPMAITRRSTGEPIRPIQSDAI
jgi:hypothetical protein